MDDASHGAYCKFVFDNETQRTTSSTQVTSRPEFKYDKTFNVYITDEFINHLSQGSINIDVRLDFFELRERPFPS